MRRGRSSILGTLLAAIAVAFAVLAATGSLATGLTSGTRARSAGNSDCHKNAPPILHDGFPEPPTRYSRGGQLDVGLTAALGQVPIDGKRVMALSYDGSFPGPTLVICARDHLTVHMKNDLTEPTNLHTHGFHVSPEANHDNVFERIEPGQSFTYEYDIPQDMPAGAYWYHPHLHMFVEPQIFAGLAGAIVQEGGLDTLPSLRHVPQRWIVIQNTQIKAGKIVPAEQSSETDARLYVNGIKDPTAKIHPGELQRWRIFNADADRFVVLRLAHGQRFQLLAEDGHTLAKPLSVSTLQIAPGSRREVLVRGGKPGAYQLKAIPFASFPGGEEAANGGPMPNETLLTLRSSGKPHRMAFPAHATLAHPVDLRGKPIDRKRTIVFNEMTEPSGASAFTLNGMKFDPERVDVTMKLGSIEQWTLINETSEWHTFHIHINDFQVVSVAGKPVPYVLEEDNVALPPKSQTVVLMHPTDFTGKFVFHCHVTFHEDHGMMAAVQVVREPTAAQTKRSIVREEGGLAISSGAYGSSASPPSVRALLFWCRALGISPPARAAHRTT